MAIRKFDGKNFVSGSSYRLKSDATKEAKRARKLGKMARVVKEQGGYCVYVRN